jgi:hypothetical protein
MQHNKTLRYTIYICYVAYAPFPKFCGWNKIRIYCCESGKREEEADMAYFKFTSRKNNIFRDRKPCSSAFFLTEVSDEYTASNFRPGGYAK